LEPEATDEKEQHHPFSYRGSSGRRSIDIQPALERLLILPQKQVFT